MQDDGNKNPRLPKLNNIPAVAWLGGLSMTGGLVALSLLFTGKSENLADLDKKYTETVINYNSEVDSLSNELKRLAADYSNLTTRNDSIDYLLETEKSRNRQLSSANAAILAREAGYKKNFTNLLSTSGKINEQNKQLQAETEALRQEITQLQDKLNGMGKENRDRQAVIDSQESIIATVSADAAGLRDSVKREDVSGWFNNTELGGGYGLYMTNKNYAHYFYGITTINGYVINKHFLTGIGTGVDIYNGGWLVPLFLDVRYALPKGKYTPYIYADGGFQLNLEHPQIPNSVFMNPGIGVYKIITNRLALNISAGMFVQEYDFRSAFVNLKVGIYFKK